MAWKGVSGPDSPAGGGLAQLTSQLVTDLGRIRVCTARIRRGKGLSAPVFAALIPEAGASNGPDRLKQAFPALLPCRVPAGPPDRADGLCVLERPFQYRRCRRRWPCTELSSPFSTQLRQPGLQVGDLALEPSPGAP